MIVLIGSKAAQYWRPEFWRNPLDTDLIATFKDFCVWMNSHKSQAKVYHPFDGGKKYFVQFLDGSITEVELALPGTSAEAFLNLVEGEVVNGKLVPTLDWLFTLKSSHKYLKNSPHFEKTVRDYHIMKYILGCRITNQEWFKFREKETYNYIHPKLNQSKKDFFSNDNIQYVYDHDSMHQAVAINEQPAYKSYLKDGEEVLTSKKKWDMVSDRIKLNGVLEEAYVLGLERSQIPYRDQITPFQSFKIALSKICTSVCSGYFREYAYENYYKVLNLYSDDYVKWFDNGVKSGLVKRLNKEKVA